MKNKQEINFTKKNNIGGIPLTTNQKNGQTKVQFNMSETNIQETKYGMITYDFNIVNLALLLYHQTKNIILRDGSGYLN